MELNVTKCLVKGADWLEEILLSSDLEYLLLFVAVHTFFSFGSSQGRVEACFARGRCSVLIGSFPEWRSLAFSHAAFPSLT